MGHAHLCSSAHAIMASWHHLHPLPCFTQVLNKPGRSLAALLQLYCGFTADKTYQTADWTQRPLSPAMQEYARTDVHYLLYVAALLR
jgi:hypothetical protein